MAKLVGTAGHVDHGKTSLIRALTGIDADRLPEEKRREMTIDLGFAYLDLPRAGRVSIVDVPGHEKFLTNMLVGALGMDLAMLCVAADGGVMPQTREHLAILEALPVERLLVVLTRCDLADAELRLLVREDIQAHLEKTRFANAEFIETSAATGAGIDALRDWLDEQLSLPSVVPDGPWYLPVDRIFTVKGFGAVVTGTLGGGKVKVGDEVAIEPGGIGARVRSIQSHERDLQQAEAGMRTALNLSGVKSEDIERGVLLGKPGTIFASDVLDIKLRRPAEAKHGSRIRLSIGADEAIGKLFLNDADPLLAQVRLERKVGCRKGQPVILRRYSPPHLVGSGIVEVPAAKVRRKSEAVVTAQEGSLDDSLVSLVGSEPKGISSEEAARRLGRSIQDLGSTFEQLLKSGRLLGFAGLWFSPNTFEQAASALMAALEKVHEAQPSVAYQPREKVVDLAGLGWRGKPLDRIIAHLVHQGKLSAQGTHIKLASFNISLSPKQEALLARVMEQLHTDGVNVPFSPDLAEKLHVPTQAIDEILRLGSEAGRVVFVAEGLVYTSEFLQRLKEQMAQQFGGKPFSAGDCRDAWNSSRKFVIPLLEYFDRTQFTLRTGDQRIIRGSR
jgi:selenocysteine-specific elongation factor